MRSIREITALLDELEHHTADDLEAQDLDFKAWPKDGVKHGADLVVQLAICLANGDGGTAVFGVADRVIGRAQAVIGVPAEIDVNRLRKAVYDSTDPKLTPVFEELFVPEGTGRLIVMQVHPGLPPYTDTAGRGTIRVGKDCQPLTGTLRRRVMVETGETDFSATLVQGAAALLISPSAMEQLRDAARKEKAPEELLGQSDLDLLGSLGLLRGDQLTRGGLLVAGKEAALREHVPAYVWTHLRMRSDTDYSDRADGHDALPVALARITDRIMADNPIATVQQGLFHFEYRTYPEIALREALLNAFCHADFRLASPILVKQFARRIEIANPGGFIGGVTVENILHHIPATRNPNLVEALTRLRLVNRSNLGVQRMFSALLIEGKAPPQIEEAGESVKVTFVASELSAPFRAFVADEDQRGRLLGVDHLLVLQHLLRHAEIDTTAAARLCQRTEADTREMLSKMERDFRYLERGGTGRGTYWRLVPSVHGSLAGPGDPDLDRRTDWDAAKTRVLSILRQRAERGEPGLTNQEIRRVTRLDRNQVYRLMVQLAEEEPRLVWDKRGRGARFRIAD